MQLSEERIAEIHQRVFDCLIKEHYDNPDSFFFTLRQINRGERLDKGYWFHGNNDYLAVSFWSGRDWLSKLPRISFMVHYTGWVSLDFSFKDVDDDIFSKRTLEELNINTSNNIINHGYSKPYDVELDLSNLETVLINFLKEDKVKIDNAIETGKLFYPGEWLEYAEDIDFINKIDFLKNLERIKQYQTKKRGVSSYLENIEIKNFGFVNDVRLENLNKNNWVFITGENGSGKTSILKAIALGLCHNSDNDKKIIDDLDFQIKIKYSDSPKTYLVNKESFSENNLQKIKGFSSYGPVRLLSESYLDENFIINKDQIQDSLVYGLFNSIGILKDLQSDYPLIVRPKYHELEVENILDNLGQIMPHHEFAQIIDGELLFYFYDHEAGLGLKGGIPYSKLPSGTKNYISLLIDMLVRFQNQQPEVSDMANYKGIVIIDEIDLHLHPKMQVEFVKQLSETFPKIQFIVTTHSPIPLLGAPPNSTFIKVVHDYKEGVIAEKLDIDISNLLPNSILSSPIFDFDKLFPESHDKSKKVRTENSYEEILKRDEIRGFLKKAASKLRGE